MSLVPAHSPLRQLRLQPRFISAQLTVLVLHNGYFAQAPCSRALTRLGHRVVPVPVGSAGGVNAPEQVMDQVLRAAVEHRPDMLLSIDHIGFDRRHWLGEVLDAMGLPTAVWYVDSPFFLQHGYDLPAPQVTSLFVWDRSYVPLLQACGAARVHHLPLATELDAWACAAPRRAALSFVGHSGVALEQRWAARLDATQHQQSAVWQDALCTDRQQLIRLLGTPGMPPDARISTLAHATFAASQQHRVQLLRAVQGPSLQLFGDAAWRGLVQAQLHGPVAYGAALAQVYAGSAISLNVTSLQMPSTVNQRVFDIPAAGGFVLTDAQAELEQLFEPQEMARYTHADGLAEQVRTYAAQPALRQAMTARARQRIAAQHTYVHRMTTLVQSMRQQHGA